MYEGSCHRAWQNGTLNSSVFKNQHLVYVEIAGETYQGSPCLNNDPLSSGKRGTKTYLCVFVCFSLSFSATISGVA